MKDEQEGGGGEETVFSQQYLTSISVHSRDLKRVERKRLPRTSLSLCNCD